MFLLPKTTLAGRGAGDRVLLAGPGTGDALLLHTEDWSWHRLANRPQRSRFWGTAVMEPGGPRGRRVTLIGGADVEGPNAPSRNQAPRSRRTTSEFLDLNDPGWADQDHPSPEWHDGRRSTTPGALQHRAAPRRLQAVERGRPGPAGARRQPLQRAGLRNRALRPGLGGLAAGRQGERRADVPLDRRALARTGACCRPATTARTTSRSSRRARPRPGRASSTRRPTSPRAAAGRDRGSAPCGALRRPLPIAVADPVGRRAGGADAPGGDHPRGRHGAALDRARPARRRGRGGADQPARPERRAARLVHALRSRLPGRSLGAGGSGSTRRRRRSRRPRRHAGPAPVPPPARSLDRRARGCGSRGAGDPSRTHHHGRVEREERRARDRHRPPRPRAGGAALHAGRPRRAGPVHPRRRTAAAQRPRGAQRPRRWSPRNLREAVVVPGRR